MTLPINVTSTSNNMDTLSRNELVGFINDTLALNYTKVEQMCSGAAYCQMLHMLWPKNVPIKKVKFTAKLETAWIDNWKVLQETFKKLQIEKDVPIQRLVKGRFQDNFEFLQWFYKFFTINDDGSAASSYDAVAVRGGPAGGAHAASRSPVKRPPIKKAAPAPLSNVKRSGSNQNNAEVKRLQGEVTDLNTAIEGLEKERDFYFSKLRDIEVVCQEKEGDDAYAKFVADIIEILYATEEGFGPAEDGGVEAELEGEPEIDDEEAEEQEEY